MDDPAAGRRPFHHRPRAGLDTAAQRAQQVQVDVARHFHRIALMRDGVVGEGGLAEIADAGACPVAQPRHRAGGPGQQVERIEGLAIHGRPALALRAGAVRQRRQNDMIARRDLGDAQADRHHHARPFMAQDRWERLAQQSVAAGDVGVAQACRDDAHQHLMQPDLRQIDRFDREGIAGIVADGSGCLHDGTSTLSIGAAGANLLKETCWRGPKQPYAFTSSEGRRASGARRHAPGLTPISRENRRVKWL